jgi:N-acetyl sugar amidotransferase
MYEIKFCKRCLYSSEHPLGIIIDEEEICSGCRIHEEKDSIDWSERWERLEKLVQPYRSLNKYDCIVPVSGSQDSYFILHMVKNNLGLNPLVVNYNKYFNTPLGIKNLSNLRSEFNVDVIQQNVNPKIVKKIIKSSLRALGSIYWPILAGQTVFPVQCAARFKIPLIIWGAHQGTEQVGMFSYKHEVEMTRRYRKDHDLMGVEADDVPSIFDTLTNEDLWQFQYPDDEDINKHSVRGIYLSNFVRWDPKAQHEDMIKKYGYLTSKFSRTFDCYDHVDCFNYMNLHDLLKHYKHGYSKVTDHATREVRFGRLSRKEGLNLIKKYELKKPDYIQEFCDWIGISEQSLNFIIDQQRNPRYWLKTQPGKWDFKGLSSLIKLNKTEKSPKKIHYNVNSTLEYDHKPLYVTVGKGYP